MNRTKSFFIWLYWFFKGEIETTEQAIAMGLTHYTNLHGDAIIHMGYSRSIWKDQYGRRFKCGELLPDGRDIVMDEIKRENPELFNQ